MQYDDVITNPRWRTDAIFKIVFWLYLGSVLANQREIWNIHEGSHADIGHVTKTAIFANSRWRTAAILKIALSPYLSRELYADVHFNSHDRYLIKKIEICQIQDGGRTPYWKSFLAISRRHIGRSTRNLEQRWRITCRYRSRYQNCNFRKFMMADGRHFENSFISISQPWIIRFRSNLVHRYKFPFRAWKFDERSKFFKWPTDAILEIVFGYISAPYWPIYANFVMEMKNHMQISVTWPKRQFSQIQDGGQPPFWK